MYIYYILFIDMLKINVFMKTLQVFVVRYLDPFTCSFCCLFLPFCLGVLTKKLSCFLGMFHNFFVKNKAF